MLFLIVPWPSSIPVSTLDYCYNPAFFSGIPATVSRYLVDVFGCVSSSAYVVSSLRFHLGSAAVLDRHGYYSAPFYFNRNMSHLVLDKWWDLLPHLWHVWILAGLVTCVGSVGSFLLLTTASSEASCCIFSGVFSTAHCSLTPSYCLINCFALSSVSSAWHSDKRLVRITTTILSRMGLSLMFPNLQFTAILCITVINCSADLLGSWFFLLKWALSKIFFLPSWNNCWRLLLLCHISFCHP